MIAYVNWFKKAWQNSTSSIKTPSKLKTERSFLNLTMGTWETITADIIFHDERFDVFSLRSRTRKLCYSPSQCNKNKKKQTNKWWTRWKTRGEKITIHRQHDCLYKKIPINLKHGQDLYAENSTKHWWKKLNMCYMSNISQLKRKKKRMTK